MAKPRSVRGLLRRWRAVLPLAGPLTIVLVIGSWVLLLVLGFSLLYYGSYPESFRTSTGVVPPASPQLPRRTFVSPPPRSTLP